MKVQIHAPGSAFRFRTRKSMAFTEDRRKSGLPVLEYVSTMAQVAMA